MKFFIAGGEWTAQLSLLKSFRLNF
jgi:hypothetical protein